MKEILIFLTDGYADWESAQIAAELNKPELGFTVKTIALDKQPKKSMGGFSVLPDYEIGEPVFQKNDVALLVIPGGIGWYETKNHKVAMLVDICLEKNIPVAAICDAVTFLADHGYLDAVKHTGNTLGYLKGKAPHYKGQDFFVAAQAVSDGNFITANGTAPLEFAREILDALGVMPNVAHAKDILEELNIDLGDSVAGWYAIWKRGIYTR